MSQTIPADFAGFEVAGEQLPAGFPVGGASDADLQAVIGTVPPGADSDGRSTSIDYMQPIPGSEQSDLGAFLSASDQVVRTHNYGQSAPDDAHLLVGGSGVDFGPRIGFIDYFKIIGGGIASYIPEGVRDFEYSRIVAESARLSSVDNPEYDGIADYSAGNGKGWTLSLPTYDDVKAGFGKAYNALAATFGEGQNTRDVSGLEYKDIDSYPEDVGSGSRLSVPTGGELVEFANAMYGRSLSASNAYRDAIEQGNYFDAGLAFGRDPIVQGMGLMVGTFGLTKPFAPNTNSSMRTGAFDPSVLDSPERIMWEGLGKLEGKQGYVSQAGLDKVKSHVALFGDSKPNNLMLQRLSNALESGTPIKDADLVFYTHELNEATRTARLARELNVSPSIVAEQSESGWAFYNKVHNESLNKYQTSPFSVYDPDVLKATSDEWSDAWFNFWEGRGQ